MPTILGIATGVLALSYPALLTTFRTVLWPISIATVFCISGTTYEILAGILKRNPKKLPDDRLPLHNEPDKTSEDMSNAELAAFFGTIATSLYLFRRAKLEMFARQPEGEPVHVTVVLGCVLAMLVGHAALVLVVWMIVRAFTTAQEAWRYCTRPTPIETNLTTTAFSTTSLSAVDTSEEYDSDDTSSDWSSVLSDYDQEVDTLEGYDSDDTLSDWSAVLPDYAWGR
ncbi:hypothetical protein LTR56_017264 [Elasticomyces elasticus]|nr:hypothetical protein LTR56_017264 [Elasticomyces elasticus]KAK3639436.1 hypothetical protein LTR22_017470 [Elasticomyces elasticus]KAK4924620.1 hypothetical protein LTR49_008303 [Elasticomyces elasticus]KAK5763031.1 hypothetical protein LTS12_006815 [Elasticomyces elasticus]